MKLPYYLRTPFFWCLFGLGLFVLFSSFVEEKSPAQPVATVTNLGDIYYNSLVNSYPYMFDQQGEIELYGNPVGRFTGGFKGIFLYSGLKEALHTYSEGEVALTEDFYDLTPYYQWSGMIGLFKGGETVFYSWDEPQVTPFHEYNPEIVKWGYTNLIPDPETKIADKTAQEVYDVVLSRFCRLMMESYAHLEKVGFDREVANYRSKMEDDNFEALDYFENRYGGILTDYEDVEDYSGFKPSMAMSFWLRRRMDGSEAEFYKGFTKVMESYDAKWFKGLNR